MIVNIDDVWYLLEPDVDSGCIIKHKLDTNELKEYGLYEEEN